LDFYKCGYPARPYIRSMAENFLTLKQVTVQLGGVKLLNGLDWNICRGEQWAVVGPSGGGKTLLAHTLLGLHFASGHIGTAGLKITMVERQHRFRGRPGATDLYYQQRFNSADAEATITVAEELSAAGAVGEADGEWLNQLQVRALLTKPLIQLSNGENKRVQLAIALREKPDLLILDNPFLGLDVEGRSVLNGIIDRLAAGGTPIILITGEHEIPACITHIGRIENGQWSFAGPKAAFRPTEHRHDIRLDPSILAQLKDADPGGEGADQPIDTDHPVVIRMCDVSIHYGDATILDHINWEVRQGERWSVSGPNGAGKSTLLSLITADNPQAYANPIWLFGRRRGTGETIWEIKQKIGFVSPELHLYFDPGASCFEVVASGLFDTIGLFRPLTPDQESRVLLWTELLSLQDIRMRRMQQLSAGQQRMILLARALIKNPPMLILDEPCQGLDEEQTAYFRELITVLCEAFDKTLIYVSHYRHELPGCIDKFLRLEQGKQVG
jgi:molybdate transport system ATP-binding protein